MARLTVRSGRPAVAVIAAFLCTSAGAQADWVTFQNQTTERLVADASVGSADGEEKDYAWADLDKDGDIDLVVVRKQPWTSPGGRRNVLLMNEGVAEGWPADGVLVDRTTTLAPQMLDLTNDRDVAIADVNGDGWPDIITAVQMGSPATKLFTHPRIYMNRARDGSGTWLGFELDDVDRIPTFPCAPDFMGVAAGDVDGDGDVDLYFLEGHFSSFCELDDRLLLNQGDGYFVDSGTSVMTAQMLKSAYGTAVAMSDMNGNGAQDVVKSTSGLSPVYVSISYDAGVGASAFKTVYGNAPTFVSAADLNNDGRQDLIVTDDGTDRYLLNQGNGPDGLANFTTHSFQFSFGPGGGEQGFGGGSRAADLDRDGFLDVLIADVDFDIAGCPRRLHIFRNFGNPPNVTLKDEIVDGAVASIPVEDLKGTFDVAVFDINGDGWLDLVIGRCTGTSVWINVPPCQGDLDGDGDVDQSDLGILLADYGCTGGTPARPCPGDVDGDGDVDQSDLGVILARYGAACP
jgi:hypothetical protein